MQPRDRVRVLGCDLFDVDPAPGRDHGEVQLGGAVEREARVVLLGDVCRPLDPKAPDHVALDVHAQDVARVHSHLLGGIRELDAARLATPADLHLGLHHHGVAEPFGRVLGLVHGVGDLSGRYGDAVAREVLLALVLK